jgi:hypothetical protein
MVSAEALMNHVLRLRAFAHRQELQALPVVSGKKREEKTLFIRFLANLLSVYFSLRIQAFGILTPSARWKITVAHPKVFFSERGRLYFRSRYSFLL